MRKIILFLVFIPSFCLADGSELNEIWTVINNGFANSYQSTERIGDNVNIIRQDVESNPYRYNQIISSFNNLQSLLQSWSALTAKESTLSAAKSTLDSIKTVLQNRLDGYFPDFAQYLSDISSASSSVDSKLDQLNDIYYKLDEIAKDGTLSSLNDSFGIFQNQFGDFVTEVESSLSGLATESTLSEVNLKLDDIATENTLKDLYDIFNIGSRTVLVPTSSTTLSIAKSSVSGGDSTQKINAIDSNDFYNFFQNYFNLQRRYMGISTQNEMYNTRAIYTVNSTLDNKLSSIDSDLDSFGSYLASLNDKDFATETTLQAVLSAIDGLSSDFSRIDLSDLATQATLLDINHNLDYLAKDETLYNFYHYFSSPPSILAPFAQVGYFRVNTAGANPVSLSYVPRGAGNFYDFFNLNFAALDSILGIETYNTAYIYKLLSEQLPDISASLSSISSGGFDFDFDSLRSLLTSLNDKDFATETTLQAVLSAIEAIDLSDIDLSELATEETLLDLSTFIKRQDFFAYPGFDNEYADIGFASNSVAYKVQLSYSTDDFFGAAISLLSDGNKIEGSVTRFLKQINDKMPKTVDTSEDESRISSQIGDVSSQMDSLRQSFDFTSSVKFRNGSSNYFKYDSLFNSLPDSDSLPTVISIKLPAFSDYSTDHYFEIETVNLSGLFDVSRACFTVLYFVLISGFVWFLFRLFIPCLLRFSKLLANVFNW